MILIFCVLGLMIFFEGDASLPSYIKVCARTDPEFNNCAQRNGQETLAFLIKGDRKHSLPIMDPFNIPHIESMIGENNAKTRVNFEVIDMLAMGMKDATVLEIRHDFNKKFFSWVIKTPKIYAVGKYTVTGKFIVVPIRGHGDFNATLNDLMLNLTATYNLTQKENGKTYMNITGTTLVFDLSKFRIYLDNLFEGNKELGAQINNFLNENWKEGAELMGPIIAEAVNIVFRSILERIANIIPYDEGFPETLI